MKTKTLMVSAAVLIFGFWLLSVNVNATSDTSKVISDNLMSLQTLPKVVSSVKAPEIINPDWLQAQINAEQQYSQKSRSGGIVAVTYSVGTSGIITADLSEFQADANQTLNDSRGWSRMGVSFSEVSSGGDFTLVLSDANDLPGFSSGCTIDWSCTVGRNVIINQDRWLGASASWNASGGSLHDYRNMVINHEVGHWLGHGHLYACGPGGLAPVMMQQSIDLNGCIFNPWPLDSELWSSTLGI